MPTRAALAALFAASLSGCPGDALRKPPLSAAAPATSRAAIAAALGRVRVGMTAEEARRIVGPPDDVLTEDDPGVLELADTREIWAYGASGHREFPTSGQVFVDDQRRVQSVHGGRGAPPPPSVLGDDRIRALLPVLARVPSYDGISIDPGEPHYDPRAVIRAVNALQPLGKERALAAIDEFLRVASGRDPGRKGMFLVLRVLFDLPEDGGAMPPMRVGAPSPPAPEDPRLAPRFPIALAGDIPFLLVRGYSLGGEAEPPESHVDHFRRAGVLRSAPLHPRADPLAALDAIEPLLADGERRELCRDQAVVMLDAIHRVEPDVHGQRFPGGDDAAARWADLRRAVGALRPRWDDRLGLYTFADGTTLGNASEAPRRVVSWSLGVPGMKARVTLRRRDRHFVGVEVRFESLPDTAPPGVTVRVVDVTGGGRSVLVETTCQWPASAGVRTQIEGKTVELAPGAEVRVERTARGEEKSAVLRP